jgi:hypothetical protein
MKHRAFIFLASRLCFGAMRKASLFDAAWQA